MSSYLKLVVFSAALGCLANIYLLNLEHKAAKHLFNLDVNKVVGSKGFQITEYKATDGKTFVFLPSRPIPIFLETGNYPSP